MIYQTRTDGRTNASNRFSVRVRAWVAGTILVTGGSVAGAQVDSVGSREWAAKSCAAAASTLSQPNLDSRALGAALASVQTCAEEGPTTLAQLWKNAPSDSASRRALASVSGRVRDQRVFDALVEVASDQRVGTPTRLDAITALTALTDSSLVIELRAQPSRGQAKGPRVEMSRLSHPVYTAGTHSLPPDVAARVTAVLERLSTSDSDSVVRYVSAAIVRRLAPSKT
jgi:hypothetical protein